MFKPISQNKKKKKLGANCCLHLLSIIIGGFCFHYFVNVDWQHTFELFFIDFKTK
jgi:hypothetical protein